MQNFRDVRVFFSKTDECKYIGHLDVNRLVTRSIQRAQLPIWRTEGFNKHIYITFSNPLSLGYSSLCESFDIRLIDDDFDISTIPEMLNKYLPQGINIIKATYPKYKNSEITSATYSILLSYDDISNAELYSMFKSMLESNEIIVEKKTKKGIKEINLFEYLSTYDMELTSDAVAINIELPSGGNTNINPLLFIKKVEQDNNIKINFCITRNKMMVNGNEFE